MSLPTLAGQYLPAGIHDAALQDVLEMFGGETPRRQELAAALLGTLEQFRGSKALYAFIAGSFVSRKIDPEDVDIVVVFPSVASIPSEFPDGPLAGVDLLYASEDEPSILSALVKFLSSSKLGSETGIVRLQLGAKEAPLVLDPDVNESSVTAVRMLYALRTRPRSANVPGKRKGLLITIHGIRTHAPWNAEVSRFASSQGWVVAPFVYGYTPAVALVCESRRRSILTAFRTWLDELVVAERLPVSVIAHSFGTYVFARYLTGFDEPPHRFQSAVLTGCILDESLHWKARFSGKVGKVLNEVAPADPWVCYMPAVRRVAREPLFGAAGVNGFLYKDDLVEERTTNLFDHGSALLRDVVCGRWLPFLAANRLAKPKNA